MNKLLTFVVLVLISTNSFGQKVTVVNFTGCLATTTFCQWSSIGLTEDQATAGWVSAIAAPSVDVSKITDLKIELESNSNSGNKIEKPTTLPINFAGATQNPMGDNVPVLFTQSYIKQAGSLASPTIPARWRKTQVFINPLTIASLPLIISKTGMVQPGYSFAAEIQADGSSLQLHSNGQAVYLAFNAAAKELSFEMENNGKLDDVNDNAYVYVEHSADLKSWKKMQEIQLVAPQSPAVKTPYTIAVKDTSSRYIRIRIDRLKNNRSSRREIIRSISLK